MTVENDYIFKFNSASKKISINGLSFEFYEKVYAVKYKEPDSIFTRELFLKTETEYSESADLYIKLNEYDIIENQVILIQNHFFFYFNRL